MKILVVSDTHGHNANFKKVLEAENPDKVFHLGDSMMGQEEMASFLDRPFVMVRGNCDYYNCDSPLYEVTFVGNKKVFLTHGHHHDVYYSRNTLRAAARDEGCDVVLYGHTHCPELDYNYGMITGNPGSLSNPRQVGRKPTYMLIEVDEDGEPKFKMKTIEEL